jgi:hypothetical protein
MLDANSMNRPLTRSRVVEYAAAMERGEWLVTHQGIAFDSAGVLLDGQHRLAAIVEADQTIEMTVFSDVPDGTFGVLDTGKKRSAGDTLAVEGEKSTNQLAAMLKIVYLYDTRPELAWSGRASRLSNPQVLELLEEHPNIRDYVHVGEQIGQATGMIKTAAGASSYLIDRRNRRAALSEWYEGIIEGTGLGKGDPRLAFRNAMHQMSRQKAGQPLRRKDSREHVAIYLTAFNAWSDGERVRTLRYHPTDAVPQIAKI